MIRRPPRSTLFPYTTLFRSTRPSASRRSFVTEGFRLQAPDDLGRPGAGVDARVPFLDLALLVDDHAHALRALLGVGIGAVGGPDLPIDVADQREVEVELLGECLVLSRGVEGHADDGGTLLVVVGLEVAEPATFRRSARCVGLGVEPEHERLALEVRQLHGLAGVIAAGEIRSLVTWVQHGPSLLTLAKPSADSS